MYRHILWKSWMIVYKAHFTTIIRQTIYLFWKEWRTIKLSHPSIRQTFHSLIEILYHKMSTFWRVFIVAYIPVELAHQNFKHSLARNSQTDKKITRVSHTRCADCQKRSFNNEQWFGFKIWHELHHEAQTASTISPDGCYPSHWLSEWVDLYGWTLQLLHF